MGEVYQATDTNLKRQVAIKVLPTSLAGDPERLARFQREAEVLAALNHPNIAHIHGLEKSDGTVALVMELVEGPTLADRIAQGAIPIDEALPIAKQIADALEAAHEQGIIHRDLKPANIKVRPDGIVKILDFGLAKALEPTGAMSASVSMSPTITSPAMTQAGIILGTAAYMSPEQAVGKPVDKRSDLWSFGVVLLEMLTGRQVFHGETVSHVLASVLKDEPDWTALTLGTPVPIRRLLRRCLEKDRKRRLDSAVAARLEIDDVLTPPAEGTGEPALRTRSRLAWILTALSLAFAITLVAVAYFKIRPVEEVAIRAVVLPPNKWAIDVGPPPTRLAISPDGRRLAFVAARPDRRSQLWVQSIDALSAQALTGTEEARSPFWAPDSRFLGFFADGKLKKIDVTGGPAVTLCDAGTTDGGTLVSGAWNRDGVIVFAKLASALSRVSASGGTATSVTTLEDPERSQTLPSFLPDGKHFLFRTGRGPGAVSDVRVGSLDSRESRPLLQGVSQAMYSQGRVLFVRDQTLMAQPFDVRRLELSGDPVPIAEPVVTGGGGNSAFSVSANGTLVYQAGSVSASRLTWMDRVGKELSVLGEEGDWDDVQLSSDGIHATVSARAPGRTTRALWIFDLSRGLGTPVTFGDSDEISAIWSPDDARIVFGSNRKERQHDLFGKASSITGREDAVLEDSVNKVPNSWSPDGRFILYTVTGPNTDLWVLPLFGDRKPFPFANAKFSEDSGNFSPDGRWIAYRSNESGPLKCTWRHSLAQDRELGSHRPVYSAVTRDGDTTARNSSTWHPITS